MTAKESGVAQMAATAVKAVAGGAAMLAVGAVGAGAGALAAKTKTGAAIAERAQKIQSGYGRIMENVGLRQVGSTADANSKRVENEAGLMAKEYTSAKATGGRAGEASMARIRAMAKSGRGARGAAAMKVLADNKDLGETFGNDAAGLSAMATRMSNAEAFGATGIREKAEKLDPRLRAFNRQAIDKAGGNVNDAVGAGFSRASVADIRGYSSETLKDPEFIKNVNASTIEKSAQEMSANQVTAIKSHKTTLHNKMWSELGTGPTPSDPKKIQQAYDWAPENLQNKLRPDLEKLATINRL